MAALNFPQNPAVNDEYTANGLTFRWDGTKWDAVTTIAANVTDNISEGSTNLYFTDARARNALSGSGIISYDSSTGVISAVSESIEDILGATVSAGTGISVSYADNGANSGVLTISASVADAHVASEREVQIGANNTKIVTPLGLENSRPAKGGRQTWTGYTYETGTVDVAGEIKKDSDGNWNVIGTSGHSGLFGEIRSGTHIRIEHDSSNYEEGTVFWAEDNETRRRFRLEAGHSHSGSFSDGDSITLTTESETQKAISDRTDIARTNVAETFDLGVTIASGNLTLSSGNVVISSGDLAVSENANVSGSLTVGGSASFNAATILLNADESGTPSVDVGFEVERGGESNKRVIWDESEDKWSFGSETVAAGKFEGDGSGITGIAASQVSGLPSDTDDLSEGSANLYHTNARVEAVVSGYAVAGDGISIVHADAEGGSNTLTFSATAAVPAAQVATERETMQGTVADRAITPQRLEQYQESEHPLETWTGYSYETGTLAAGNLVKSGSDWKLIGLAADSGIFDRIRKGSRIRIAHDSANYEDGVVGDAFTDSSTRTFKLETGFSSAGSFSDGDTITLTTEGRKVHQIRDGYLGEAIDDRVNSLLAAGDGLDKTYTDSSDSLSLAVDSTVARTNAAETFDRAVTVASGGVTLTSGDLTVSSGDVAVTAGDMTLSSGDLTLSNGGMTLTSGDLALSSGDLTVSEDLSVSGNVTISGNLTISGSSTRIETETITLADNIFLLNSNQSGTPTQNAGIEVERGDSANKSILWDETNDKWSVGSETFVAGKFEGDGSGITGIAASQISGLPSDTDGLSEGSTNLYFTNARARGAVSASSDAIIDYDSTTGVIDTDDAALNSHVSGIIAVGAGLTKSVAANGVITLAGTVTQGQVATEKEVQQGTNNAKIVTALGLENSQWSQHPLTTWTGYTYETGTLAAGTLVKSGSEWSLYPASGHALLASGHLRMDSRVRIEHDASTFEEGFLEYSIDDGSVRKFKFRSGSLTGSVAFADGDAIATLSTEGFLPYHMRTGTLAEIVDDRVASLFTGGDGIDATYSDSANTLTAAVDSTVARTNAAETFDRAVTVASGGVTLTSGDLTVSSGDVAVTAGGMTVASGSLTLTSGDLTLSSGDLAVDGDVSLSTGTITLNSEYSGSSPTADAGMEVERGTLANASFIWDESEDQWTAGSSPIAASVFKGSGSGLTDLVSISASAPSAPSDGDLWFKSDTAELFIRYNDGTDSAWMPVAMPADAEVDLASADTDDLSEGSSNLYHTTARARGAVSASSDAIVDYDSSTGVFTTDDAQLATEVNSILSAGTGVDISKTNNVVTISADIDEVVTASSDAIVNVSNSGLITTDDAQFATEVAAVISAGTGLSESKTNNVVTLAVNADSDGIGEGSTNLYFTDARAQAAITASSDAVVGVSGGVIDTDDANFATAMNSVLSAGTGVDISKTNNVITLSADIDEVVTASSDSIVDVSASGLLTTDSTSLATAINSTLSAGTGVDLSKTNNVITISADIDEVVTASSDSIVNVSASGLITTDDAQFAAEVAAVISAGTGLSESKTGNVVTLAVDADSDGISEGSTNLYHTQARARGAVSASSDAIVDYDSSTGVFTSDATSFATLVNSTISAGTGVDISKTNNVITLSADIDEVVTASSDAVVNVSNSGLITTDDAQLATEVAAIISAGAGLSESKTGNVITLAVDADSDEISEGSTNLFFTDARAQAAITASSDAVVNVSAGVISTDDAQLATEVNTIISAGTGITKSKSGNVVTLANAYAITASASAPSSPSDGDLWIDTESAELFFRYSDGTDSSWLGIAAANANAGGFTRMAAVTTDSGTEHDFTGIPAGTQIIDIVFDQVSIDGGDDFLIQIGDAGGVEDSGYDSGSPELGDSVGGSAEISTSGYALYSNNAGYKVTGTVRLHNASGNIWVASGIVYLGNDGSNRAITAAVNGRKELSAQLDRVRITTDDGSDLFDGGSVSVFYH